MAHITRVTIAPVADSFLLLALSLLVDSGMNIQGINREKQNEKETEELFSRFKPKASLDTSDDKEKKVFEQEFKRKRDKIIELIDQHSSAVTIVGLLFFSLPLYLLFRHSPAIPDLRLSECFVAMVYITNMIVIYDIIPSLLCFSVKTEAIYDVLSLLLAIIPIKQLSGYSYVSTIWRLLAALIPFIIMGLLLLFAAIIIIGYSI